MSNELIKISRKSFEQISQFVVNASAFKTKILRSSLRIISICLYLLVFCVTNIPAIAADYRVSTCEYLGTIAFVAMKARSEGQSEQSFLRMFVNSATEGKKSLDSVTIRLAISVIKRTYANPEIAIPEQWRDDEKVFCLS